MRGFISGVALAAIVILVQGTSGMAADENGRPGTGVTTEALYQQTCSDDPTCDRATVPAEVFLAGDSDRGCCVWKTSKPKCVYTNKAFCVRKAKQANIAFEFYKGAECKTIPACQ
jgi:hypothetical protein